MIRLRWLPFLLITSGLIHLLRLAGIGWAGSFLIAIVPAWVLGRFFWLLVSLTEGKQK
jgi:hypothetical protein